jgi:hypothetical protein
VAHFDRVIPAGGEGKVTLKVDLRGYQGKVWKSATVFSNDGQKSSLTINLQGKVKPWIDIRPSRVIQFRKAGGGGEEKSVDLISGDLPFSILKAETSLQEKIRFQIETVVEKKHYRIKVSPLIRQGSYSGTLKCVTDHPKKSEVFIQVLGQFDNY